MARATSISLSKFTETVQGAVRAAVQKHPKFKIEPPTQLAISYLIRGIPVPEAIAANVTVREAQAFATEIASQIGSGPQGALAGRPVEGVLYAEGKHLIVGIPAVIDVLIEK